MLSISNSLFLNLHTVFERLANSYLSLNEWPNAILSFCFAFPLNASLLCIPSNQYHLTFSFVSSYHLFTLIIETPLTIVKQKSSAFLPMIFTLLLIQISQTLFHDTILLLVACQFVFFRINFCFGCFIDEVWII